MRILDAALTYQKQGYSVIPVMQDKTPLVKWEPHQKIRATKEQIREWWEKWPSANVGIVTGEISNLLVVDTDSKESSNKILDMIPSDMAVPCEMTPNGGMHFFFKHEEGFINRSRVKDEIDIRTTGGFCVVAPSIDSNKKKWEFLPNLDLFSLKPCIIPENIKALLSNAIYNNNCFIYRDDVTEEKSVTKRNILFEEGGRDESLFSVAFSLAKDNWIESEVSQVIDILAKNCIPEFPTIEARAKVKSAFVRLQRKERNLTKEIKDWVSVTNGNFCVTNAYHSITMRNNSDRAKVRVILARMVEAGEIKRVTDKDGWFCRIDKDLQEINWQQCDDTPVSVIWPFGLERYYLCLPKNIIVIAGSPDAGKTAFCLNFAQMNMDKYKINYFSSEMGALELKVRLKKFGFPFKHWTKVGFRERNNNYADVIDPDGINIVDYIEMPEEPWKIALPINDIFRKLKKGICIIALQKPKTRDVARGGEATLDRPRLYLSMGGNRIKILKCKNWANEEINPNGLMLDYKILQGCKFIQETEWSDNITII